MGILEDAKKEVDEEASTLMALSGIQSIKNEQGTMSLKTSSRSTLKKDILQEELLKRGLAATAVVEIIQASTIVTDYAFVDFRENKKKNGG